MFQDSLKTVSYILKYFWNLKICLKESSISKILYRTLKTIFYVLNYNFSYIKLSFVFLLQNNSYSNTDDIILFFFFFFRKILVPFPYFFLKLFFVFLTIFITRFSVCIQKNYKNFFKLLTVFIYTHIWSYSKVIWIVLNTIFLFS